MKDIRATEEECRAYYEEHKDSFKKGAQASAKHILTATEEESKKILAEIQNGEKDLSRMRRKNIPPARPAPKAEVISARLAEARW